MRTHVRALIAAAALGGSGAWVHAAELAAPASQRGDAVSDRCAGDDSGLTLPAGFCATIFADGIGHARQLAVSSSGVVYVNTWSGVYYGNAPLHAGGFLVALKDTNGDGKADLNERFGPTAKEGGTGGTGIALYRSALYAEVGDKILRYPLKPGALLPDVAPQVTVRALPVSGDHPMHPFVIDRAGQIYMDSASATNACQERDRSLELAGLEPCRELETRGGIWRYDANKVDQEFSPAERFATGLRNAEGLAIDTSGRIFVTQHGRDQLHSLWPKVYSPEQEATLPAEEIVLLRQGADYGWPMCYFDPVRHRLVLAPEYGGDGTREGQCARKTAPIAVYPAHWGPNALVYYSGNQFPERYRDGVFIAFHGSWNRAPFLQGGYNVVFQKLSGDRAADQCEIFADGFAGAERSPDKASHRPSGLAVGPDGSLYISDDIRGRIYRVVYQGGAESNSQARTVACPDPAAPAGPISSKAAKTSDVASDNAGKKNEASSDAASLPLAQGATRDMVVLGDQIFHGQVAGASCIGCHGARGTGTPLGPDLTSNRWVWGDGSLTAIAATIRVGVPHPRNYRSSMPPMGGAQLSADQVNAVAAYVWGLSHASNASGAARPSDPTAINIPGERIFPESITSSADGRIFIGSVGTRQVFSVDPGGDTAAPWVKANDDPSLSVFGVLADSRAQTLWACLANVPGAQGAQALSALHAYALDTGKLKASYTLPMHNAQCNDIAVAADGTVYVTDSGNMQIDRLKPGGRTLQPWVGQGQFGGKDDVLDGISVLGDRVIVNVLVTNKIFIVPVIAGGSAGKPILVKLDRPVEQPDGMRAFDANRVLLIESGGAGRLSLLTLHGGMGQLKTLKEGFSGGPVSVTVATNNAFVIEGQLNSLFNPDKANQTLAPFRATAVPLDLASLGMQRR